MAHLGSVLAAAVAFVGTHILLSHSLRRPIVSAVGERKFLGVYSAVALATLVWLAVAYRGAPASAFLWRVGDGLWAFATILMLVASILLAGSLLRNPAFPTAGSAIVLTPAARGVYAVSRHPMMWAFALWGICHIVVYPVAANIVVAAAIIVLALAGAALQDVKKRSLQPSQWSAWEAETSYFPFAAIISGRTRFGGFGWRALAGGFLVWITATWAHIPLSGWAAGIWRWLK